MIEFSSLVDARLFWLSNRIKIECAAAKQKTCRIRLGQLNTVRLLPMQFSEEFSSGVKLLWSNFVWHNFSFGAGWPEKLKTLCLSGLNWLAIWIVTGLPFYLEEYSWSLSGMLGCRFQFCLSLFHISQQLTLEAGTGLTCILKPLGIFWGKSRQEPSSKTLRHDLTLLFSKLVVPTILVSSKGQH